MSTICFFNSTKFWGGGEKWHYDMSLQLFRKGYKVIIITGHHSELKEKAINTGMVHYGIDISGLTLLNPFKMRKLTDYLKIEGVDTIVLNSSKDLKIAGLAARFAGVKRIIYRRGSAIPVKNNFLNRWIFRNLVDDVIANSEKTAATILENNGSMIESKRIHTIYNGIDLDEYDNYPAEPLYVPENEELVIGHAGRLTHQKGQHYLLDIAAMLKKRGIRFKLLIAGKGELAEELQRRVKERGLNSEVIFTGFLQNTKSLMLASDVFVLPSLWEGFGYVIAEAMACNTPVVAFDISSNPEIISDGETGFLIRPFDLEAFADKIETLSHDVSLRKQMGAAGRHRVEKLFNRQKATSLLENLIMQ